MFRRISFIALAVCLILPLPAVEDVLVPVTQDTYLQEGITGKPAGRGESVEFKLMLKPPGGEHYRALLHFKDIPNVFYKSARLKLRVLNMALGNNPGKIQVHKLTQDWDERSASQDCAGLSTKWQKSMGDYDPKIYGTCDLSLLPKVNAATLIVDITDLVREWQAKPAENKGLILILTPGSTADLRLVAHEDPEKTKSSHPWLILTQRPVLQPGDIDLQFETPRLTNGKVGQAINLELKIKGGKPPYTVSVQGMLPRGVTLSKEGMLAGTPEKDGKFNLKVRLVDSAKTEVIENYTWEVDKADPAAADQPKPDIKKPDDNKPEPPKVDPTLPQDDG